MGSPVSCPILYCQREDSKNLATRSSLATTTRGREFKTSYQDRNGRERTKDEKAIVRSLTTQPLATECQQLTNQLPSYLDNIPREIDSIDQVLISQLPQLGSDLSLLDRCHTGLVRYLPSGIGLQEKSRLYPQGKRGLLIVVVASSVCQER